MPKSWILALFLLFFAVPSPATSDESKQVTLQGCLQRSGWQYFLNERDSTREQLVGYSKLKNFVGHDIEVSGVRTVKSISNTPPGGASSVILQPVVEVKSVKDLGKGCAAAN
ncbi:MAG TPA: hypothetical protein VMU45_11525 [Candidatus Eisenbacteria bacterium]|nr:hypothetical protein [Candidatus Eisenbacteria bacterium]